MSTGDLCLTCLEILGANCLSCTSPDTCLTAKDGFYIDTATYSI